MRKRSFQPTLTLACFLSPLLLSVVAYSSRYLRRDVCPTELDEPCPAPLLRTHRWRGGWSRGLLELTLPGAPSAVRVHRTDLPGPLGESWWREVEAGQWEAGTLCALKVALLARRGVHVDSGAWVGPTALLAAHFATRVIALEPDPWAFEVLAANVAANEALPLTARRVCLAPAPVTLTFTGAGMSGSTSLAGVLSPDYGQFGANCGPLRAILRAERVPLDGWSLWKLDVEGAEASLFPAALPLLEEYGWPTVHLSLHTPFYGDNLEARTALVAAMLHYPFIFRDGLVRVPSLTVEDAKGVVEFTLSTLDLAAEAGRRGL
jgi:FkbM family methyltransferase